MAQTLHVEAPSGGYDIIFEAGALKHMADIFAERGLSGRTVVGTNAIVAPLYGRQLAEHLPNAVTLTIQDGEPYKTLQTVEAVSSGLVKLGVDRGACQRQNSAGDPGQKRKDHARQLARNGARGEKDAGADHVAGDQPSRIGRRQYPS